MIFTDEKKLKSQEILIRGTEYGYAPVGERLSNRFYLASTRPLIVRTSSTVALIRPVLPKNSEIVGAMCYIPHRALPLRDGSVGNVGLLSMNLTEGTHDIDSIMLWVRDQLCPLLNPYPGITDCA